MPRTDNRRIFPEHIFVLFECLVNQLLALLRRITDEKAYVVVPVPIISAAPLDAAFPYKLSDRFKPQSRFGGGQIRLDVIGVFGQYQRVILKQKRRGIIKLAAHVNLASKCVEQKGIVLRARLACTHKIYNSQYVVHCHFLPSQKMPARFC